LQLWYYSNFCVICYADIFSVDDLLKAGINKASHLVVVNKEEGDIECEDTLADAETIVAVQTIFKLVIFVTFM
jgi:hypothetical protein